jgi:hypothetical protein
LSRDRKVRAVKKKVATEESNLMTEDENINEQSEAAEDTVSGEDEAPIEGGLGRPAPLKVGRKKLGGKLVRGGRGRGRSAPTANV